MKKAYFYETKIGKIGLAEKDGKLTNVFFGKTVVPKEYELKETEVIKEAAKQLDEYFQGKRKEFYLPFELEGTEFEKSVWRELFQIPYGTVCTYLDIAKNWESPKPVELWAELTG